MTTSSKKKDVAESDFYTIEQLSQKTGISERSLRDAIRDNKLKASKKFTRWFVFHSDFCEFLKHQ